MLAWHSSSHRGADAPPVAAVAAAARSETAPLPASYKIKSLTQVRALESLSQECRGIPVPCKKRDQINIRARWGIARLTLPGSLSGPPSGSSSALVDSRSCMYLITGHPTSYELHAEMLTLLLQAKLPCSCLGSQILSVVGQAR